MSNGQGHDTSYKQIRSDRLGVDTDKMVMVQGTKLAAWGLGFGLVAAAIMSRVMSSQLYGVSAMDPWTFLGVALILGLVAIVATYLPAHRAARIDPALTIQGESP
jgi:ABC-type antimicrobial peptide transport system permease subunit